ncbi:DUF2867 domain-containing protein [Saccharomonospora xinjiangensis]|uniref:DUF2867 domain-containing protein n=1 Tax=Saccharomonospora xinjiangensis TaxID=75294 RepID=UPI0010C4BF6E|nr:DUF2867 domain-containing protein [Saccharomonospora xinjiangensis]QBQ59655.1 hypothetical protein EYD13_06430 [Saccharomonospora xinjiangensis]
MTRLGKTAYTEFPSLIHDLAGDFRVEDVWTLRTPGAGPHDFPVLLAAIRKAGGFTDQSPLVRLLFAIRWRIGAVLGWDSPSTGVGRRVVSLRDRLPADLRGAPRGPDRSGMPLTPVYELGTECARELANKTVHTVLHLRWARRMNGEYGVTISVLVKPNGLFGRLYMAAIAPFRHLIVYPALTRRWERAWRERGSTTRNGEPA